MLDGNLHAPAILQPQNLFAGCIASHLRQGYVAAIGGDEGQMQATTGFVKLDDSSGGRVLDAEHASLDAAPADDDGRAGRIRKLRRWLGWQQGATTRQHQQRADQ